MRGIAVASGLFVLALAGFGADNPFLGNWEMNALKSKADPSSPPVRTLGVRYAVEGSVLKAFLTTDGAPSAHPTIYDGNEHEYGGASALEPTHIVATTKGNTLEAVFKRNGTKVGTRRNTLSPDGRTMTVISEGTKPNGAKFRSVLIFEKQ